MLPADLSKTLSLPEIEPQVARLDRQGESVGLPVLPFLRRLAHRRQRHPGEQRDQK